MGEEGQTKAGAEGCKVHMSARIPKFGHHRFTLHAGSQTGQGKLSKFMTLPVYCGPDLYHN